MTSEQEWFGHEVEPKEEDWPINIKFRDGHIELWNILSRNMIWEDCTNIEAWTPVPKYTPPEQELSRMFLSGKEIEFVKHSPFQWGIRWDSARFHFSYDLYFPNKAAAHKAIDALLSSYRIEGQELPQVCDEAAQVAVIWAEYLKRAEEQAPILNQKLEEALSIQESDELPLCRGCSGPCCIYFSMAERRKLMSSPSIDEYQAIQEQLASAEEAITKVLYWEKNAHLFVFNLGPLRAHRVRYPALKSEER